MAHPTRTDRLPKSSTISTEIPPQTQKGTWLTFGVKSVCTLTGAAIGATGGRHLAALYARKMVKSSHALHPATTAALAVSMANVVIAGATLGTLGGAIAGCCVANRILARAGLRISS